MANYPVKPNDIKIDGPFWNTFKTDATEISAKLLIKMAQQYNDWRDFTKEDIDEFVEHNFCFYRLIDDDPKESLIEQKQNRIYSFTHQFIAMCFLASPSTVTVHKEKR